MTIRIVLDSISRADLMRLAEESYKEMVKAVADVERKVLAVGGELHADAEALLLENGSRQEDLWGINLYPDKPEPDRIEYTSLINIRPRQGNRSLEVQDAALQRRIRAVVDQRVQWG